MFEGVSNIFASISIGPTVKHDNTYNIGYEEQRHGKLILIALHTEIPLKPVEASVADVD